MAQRPNKTKPSLVSVDQFLAGVESEARREDAHALCSIMARLSGEPATMWGPSIVGFGRYHYRYESGREGEVPRVGFSPRKPATVLYINGAFPRHGELTSRLGKFTHGKSCIYVKRLGDLDLGVLEALIAESLMHLRTIQPTG